MELTWNLDRVTVITTKNCKVLKRLEEYSKEDTDFDINPKSICGDHTVIIKGLFKEFGTERNLPQN